MSSTTQGNATNQDDRLPPQGVRTVVTLLLIAFLMILAIGVSRNIEPTSPLRRQLTAVPLAPELLQTLFVDSAFNHHWTYGQVIDVDHHVELTINRDGANETITLPQKQEGVWPHLRTQRYQNLMYAMAYATYVEARQQDEIPAMLAEGMLKQADAPNGNHLFRVIGRMLLTPQQVSSSDAETRDPTADRLRTSRYDADVVYDRGSVILNKREEQRLSVPVQNSN